MGHPGERVSQVEEGASDLPRPHERVHEEEVPGERHQAIIHAVGVLEVDRRVLNVVATIEQELTLTVELNGLGWLIDAVGTLEVLLGTLGKLSLGRVDDLMQVVDLAELSLWDVAHDGALTRSEEECGGGTVGD